MTSTVYELINPSDPYTFEAPSIEIAGAVSVILSTSFGAKAIDPPAEDGERTPILFGWKEWLDDRGINEQWLDDHVEELADAFDSFLIGNLDQRRYVEKMLTLIPDDKKEEWKADRHDRHRSSMNRIGETAMVYAKYYRKLAQELANKRAKAP